MMFKTKKLWYLLFSFSQLILTKQCGMILAQEDKLLPSLIGWFDAIANKSYSSPPGDALFENIDKHLVLEKSIQTGVRGLRLKTKATQSLSNLVVAIPKQSLMSHQSARDISRSKPLAQLLRKKKHRNSNNQTILIAHVQCELSKLKSWWWPYLATLPDTSETINTCPLLWNDDILSISPTLLEYVMTKRAERDQIKKEVDILFSGMSGCDGIGWSGNASFSDSFDQAYALVMSRATSGIPAMMDGDSTAKALTPLLDLLNHKRGEARYLELYSGGDGEKEETQDVFGIGVQAPPGGYEVGEEILHDYEGGHDDHQDMDWWTHRGQGSHTVNCDHEMLTSYGFLEEGSTGISTKGECALLPWIGAVKHSDLQNSSDSYLPPVVNICRGVHRELSEQHALMAEALQWEIQHDYEHLSTSHFEEIAQSCNGRVCDVNTQENYRRISLVVRVARGELRVLESLNEKCKTTVEMKKATKGQKGRKNKKIKKKKTREL